LDHQFPAEYPWKPDDPPWSKSSQDNHLARRVTDGWSGISSNPLPLFPIGSIELNQPAWMVLDSGLGWQ